MKIKVTKPDDSKGNQDLDMIAMQRNLKKLIQKNYKQKLSNKIKQALEGFFENLAMFTIICLAIIFRPINLLIGGLIAITILLII